MPTRYPFSRKSKSCRNTQVISFDMSCMTISIDQYAQRTPNISSIVLCSRPGAIHLSRLPTSPCTQPETQPTSYSDEAGLLFSITTTNYITPHQQLQDPSTRRFVPKQQSERHMLDMAPSLPSRPFIPPQRCYKEEDDDEWYSEHPAGLGWVSVRPIGRSI
ncbi:hypothetical protein PV11_06325 [Exophiala sideris]|uniref:Uncharacterized protein n=1 Tax=Exophiala sideris TaxID=1016849 RepID=A0A0D1VRL5_9EURO|nr:hypothetical protein PV11_06325 [Exophiala sideris]